MGLELAWEGTMLGLGDQAAARRALQGIRSLREVGWGTEMRWVVWVNWRRLRETGGDCRGLPSLPPKDHGWRSSR